MLSSITERGAAPALVKTLAFTGARLKVIAENVANAHTPGYRARHLNVRGFQAALGKALAERKHPAQPLVVESGRQVRTGDDGRLRIMPEEQPVENVLFHDQTNLSIERQMADLAETGMTHELASTLLRASYESLRKAIRGTVT